MKMYSNGPHWSLTEKDGYTRYVIENLSMAMFLKAQLEKLGPDPAVQMLGELVASLALPKVWDEPPKRRKKKKRIIRP
jgi:hypothetical protein